MMNRTDPLSHFALRFKRYIRIGSLKVDVLKEHNSIVESDGKVLLAKFGRGAGRSRVETVLSQIKQEEKTHLYLVCRENNGLIGFAASISNLGTSPECGVKYPSYYDQLQFSSELWFTISSVFEEVSLKPIRLILNEKPLLKTLNECRTSLLLVKSEEQK